MNHITSIGEAHGTARRIERFWAKRGYDVRCTVRRLESDEMDADGRSSYTSYTIESDMVNGWPVRKLRSKQ